MALKPPEVLKKGLAKFMETIKTHKKKLSAKLARLKPFPHQTSAGWTVKQTPLMSNVFLTPWSQPQTMIEGLNAWMKMERQL
jgi:hypothetical protein